MWGWFYGMTERQIELMLIDQPIIVYPKHNLKSKRESGSSSSPKSQKERFGKPDPEAVRRAAEAWMKANEKGLATNVRINMDGYKQIQ